MAESKPLNLSFINRDVRTQLEHSREIIAVIEELNKILPEVENVDAKNKIAVCIRRLLGIVGGLTHNANSTSANAAITVISSST